MQEKTVQKLTKIAFGIFVLSVPFSYVYSLGFLENNKSYTSLSLYNINLVDIAAILFLLATLLNLYWHKKSILTYSRYRIYSVPTLAFAVFAILSFIWSGSPFLSAFWGVRIIIIILALTAMMRLIKDSDFYRNLFFKILIASGIAESLIALGQFFFQHSLGLYLLGESHLGSDILGLARIDLLGHNLLRAYGTFPHPNVLGGFLLFTIVTTIWVKPFKYRHTFLLIQLAGLGLTFSRSAILGLLLIITATFLSSRAKPRDPSKVVYFKAAKSYRFNLYFFKGIPPFRYASVGMTILFLIFTVLLVRSPIQKILNGTDPATRLRIEYASAAYHRFLDSPVLGRGWGTGPIELPAFSKFPFYSWEMQPVHNIYLLVLSDLGIIGFLIFLYFIWRVLRRHIACYAPTAWSNLFIAYLFIGLFDHYLLTLPQGIFIFFTGALLSLSESTRKEERIPLLAKTKNIYPEPGSKARPYPKE